MGLRETGMRPLPQQCGRQVGQNGGCAAQDKAIRYITHPICKLPNICQAQETEQQTRPSMRRARAIPLRPLPQNSWLLLRYQADHNAALLRKCMCDGGREPWAGTAAPGAGCTYRYAIKVGARHHQAAYGSNVSPRQRCCCAGSPHIH